MNFSTVEKAEKFGIQNSLFLPREVRAKLPPFPSDGPLEKAASWANGVARLIRCRGDATLMQAALASFDQSATPARAAATPPVSAPAAPSTPAPKPAAASAKLDVSKLTGFEKVLAIERFEATQKQNRIAAQTPQTAPVSGKLDLVAVATAAFGKAAVDRMEHTPAEREEIAGRHLWSGNLAASIPGFPSARFQHLGDPKPDFGMSRVERSEQRKRINAYLPAHA